jgi:hypothetical protein
MFAAFGLPQPENGEMALQDQLRDAAASCLELAQTAADPRARARLSMLAQKFFEIAGVSPQDQVLAKILDEFNDAQMLPPLPPQQSI